MNCGILIFLYFVHACQTKDPCTNRFQLDFYPVKDPGKCSLVPLAIAKVVKRNQCFSICVYNKHCWFLTLTTVEKGQICSIFNDTCTGKFETDPNTIAFGVKVAHCNKTKLIRTPTTKAPTTTTQITTKTTPQITTKTTPQITTKTTLQITTKTTPQITTKTTPQITTKTTPQITTQTTPQITTKTIPQTTIDIKNFCNKRFSEDWQCTYLGEPYCCKMLLMRFNETVKRFTEFNSEKQISQEAGGCKNKLYWAGSENIHKVANVKNHDLVFQFYRFTDKTKTKGALMYEKKYCGFKLQKYKKAYFFYSNVEDTEWNSGSIVWNPFVKSLANFQCKKCKDDDDKTWPGKVYDNVYCKWKEFKNTCLEWDFFLLFVRDRYDEIECPAT